MIRKTFFQLKQRYESRNGQLAVLALTGIDRHSRPDFQPGRKHNFPEKRGWESKSDLSNLAGFEGVEHRT
jgi:hypothetical protein